MCSYMSSLCAPLIWHCSGDSCGGDRCAPSVWSPVRSLQVSDMTRADTLAACLRHINHMLSWWGKQQVPTYSCIPAALWLLTLAYITMNSCVCQVQEAPSSLSCFIWLYILMPHCTYTVTQVTVHSFFKAAFIDFLATWVGSPRITTQPFPNTVHCLYWSNWIIGSTNFS